VSGTRDLCRQCGDSDEVLLSEEAEGCFVLPLRQAAAHFACRNARSAESEMVESIKSYRAWPLCPFVSLTGGYYCYRSSYDTVFLFGPVAGGMGCHPIAGAVSTGREKEAKMFL
jgi:hypothetical protein